MSLCAAEPRRVGALSEPQHVQGPLSPILAQEEEMRKPLSHLPPPWSSASGQHLPRCGVLPGPSMHAKARLKPGQGSRRGVPSGRDTASRASCELSRN